MNTITNDNKASKAQTMMDTVRKSGPALLQRVQQGLSKFQLVYTPHSQWPLPRSHIPPQYSSRRPLRISVLDSSFNPPNLAHLALANSSRSQGLAVAQGLDHEDSLFYDSKLLLLSVKNADKTLKIDDATYQQRLEMMALLALNIHSDEDELSSPPIRTSDFFAPEQANVAIAIIDEPTFVGKATTLLDFLKTRFMSLDYPVQINIPQDIETTFLVGLDTLERLFAPRYYASEQVMMTSLRKFLSPGPEGDNARIVCARRVLETPTASEEQVLSLAKEFLDTGRIAIVDFGAALKTYSSTAVRRARSLPDQGNDALWRKWVTEDIAGYIIEHGLYQKAV